MHHTNVLGQLLGGWVQWYQLVMAAVLVVILVAYKMHKNKQM